MDQEDIVIIGSFGEWSVCGMEDMMSDVQSDVLASPVLRSAN